MKYCKGLPAAMLLLAGMAAAAFTPDWSGCRLERNVKSGSVAVRGERLAGMISVKPAEAGELLKTAVEQGRLVIDTRALRERFPKAEVIFRAHGLPFEPSLRLRNMELTLEAGAEPGGVPATLYFEGNQGEAKKHYWKAKQFALSGGGETLAFEQILPEDLNELHLRFDLPGAGIYRIGKAGFAPVKEAATDPAANWLTNGGAELGWFNVGVFSGRTGAMADDGRIHDGYGKVYDRAMAAAVDGEVRRSGRNSFRLETAPDADGFFCYNSVPFRTNGPASFSVWLRAD